MTTNTSPPRQLDLPGQAHVADGPIDHAGTYLMHHAFRRDLAALVTATAVTPTDDHASSQPCCRGSCTASPRRRRMTSAGAATSRNA